MPRFELRESKRQLTSCPGLSLIGQCCETAQVELVQDRRIPVSAGMATADLFKRGVGLITLGKNDLEVIEPFRIDRFLREALDIGKGSSSEWMRQRFDSKGAALREHTDDLNLRLLEHHRWLRAAIVVVEQKYSWARTQEQPMFRDEHGFRYLNIGSVGLRSFSI